MGGLTLIIRLSQFNWIWLGLQLELSLAEVKSWRPLHFAKILFCSKSLNVIFHLKIIIFKQHIRGHIDLAIFFVFWNKSQGRGRVSKVTTAYFQEIFFKTPPHLNSQGIQLIFLSDDLWASPHNVWLFGHIRWCPKTRTKFSLIENIIADFSNTVTEKNQRL